MKPFYEVGAWYKWEYKRPTGLYMCYGQIQHVVPEVAALSESEADEYRRKNATSVATIATLVILPKALGQKPLVAELTNWHIPLTKITEEEMALVILARLGKENF